MSSNKGNILVNVHMVDTVQVCVDDQNKRTTEAHVSHMEYDISVRSCNIVRAAESLSKLVSDLKETLILNDLSSINEVITRRTDKLKKLQAQQQKELAALYTPPVGTDEGQDKPT